MAETSQTILENVSHAVGVAEGDESFKDELLIDINGALSTLNQAGCGKPLMVTGTEKWDDFKDESQVNGNVNFELAKQFVFTRVKMIFDPPSATSLNIMKGIADELIQRIVIAYSPDNPSDLKGGDTVEQE